MLSESVSKFYGNESVEPAVQDKREGSPSTVTARPARTCANCGQPYRHGELMCGNCGVLFKNALRTNKLDNAEGADLERIKRIGPAITDQFRPLNIVIGGQTVEVPFAPSSVLGRNSENPGAVPVDFDLTPYNAVEKGVSRNHAKITRDRDLIHVMDLGSTNGTYLNGFQLVANQDRILRNGDELTLGRLKVIVKF